MSALESLVIMRYKNLRLTYLHVMHL